MQTKTVKVLPMMMFYHSRDNIHYKVVGTDVYTVYHYLRLDYLRIVRQQLSLFGNMVAKTKFNIFQDYIFLKY